MTCRKPEGITIETVIRWPWSCERQFHQLAGNTFALKDDLHIIARLMLHANKPVSDILLEAVRPVAACHVANLLVSLGDILPGKPEINRSEPFKNNAQLMPPDAFFLDPAQGLNTHHIIRHIQIHISAKANLERIGRIIRVAANRNQPAFNTFRRCWRSRPDTPWLAGLLEDIPQAACLLNHPADKSRSRPAWTIPSAAQQPECLRFPFP